MAWTAGVTRTTGDLITAAQWNSYLGASGSMDYVHDQLYEVDNTSCTHLIGSILQNGTKIRVVNVSLNLDEGEEVKCQIGSGTPPITTVAWAKTDTALSGWVRMPVTFIVPPDYYYRCDTVSGTPYVSAWREWDLH